MKPRGITRLLGHILGAASLWPAVSHAATDPNPMRTALRPFLDHHQIAGVVTLVGTADRIVEWDAMGYADLAAAAPMRKDSLFWIASMSKPLTATAVMMLEDEGRLSVGDPVERYLPEFRGQQVHAPDGTGKAPALRPPKHPILIREILSHTSGLPFSTDMERPTYDLFTLAEDVKSYARTPLLWEPGTQFLYSNAGINTAGRIVEVLSGEPYENFMQERLFAPLGMIDTTIIPTRGQLARLAKSYVRDEKSGELREVPITQLKYPLDDPSRHPFPAGSYFSTASDLARFCRMLLNHGSLDGRRYLSPERITEMTSKQTGAALEKFYGFGWDTWGAGVWSHAGAYNTLMVIDPKRAFYAVLLLQYGDKFTTPESKRIFPEFVKAAAAEATLAAALREHEVYQAEYRWHQAYLEGNAAALDAIEADGFVATDERGVVTRKATDIENLKSHGPYARLVLNDPFVKVSGDAAVITGKLAAEATSDGKPEAGIYAVTDSLVEQQGTWRLLASERSKIAPTARSETEPAPRDAGWLKRHEAFAAEAKRGDADLLFLGDSITDFWRTTGAAVFKKYWGGLKTANFGLSGDRTGQVLWRIRHGELEGLHPKLVVLMIGTNNIGYERDELTLRNSPQEAAQGVTEVVAEVRRALPDSRILLLGVFPRAHLAGDPLRVAVASVNREIARLDDGVRVHYLDIGSKFLDADGTLEPAIMPDFLHPSAAGYEIWAKAVEVPIESLMR